MMEWLCRSIVIAFGLWLIGVSLLMIVKPHMALSALRKFASTNFINYAEFITRLVIGAALYGLAAYTSFPTALKIAGLFLGVTAIILMLIPRAWHHQYAVWWADKIKPWQVMLSAPFSLAVGLVVIWVAVS